MNYLTYDTMISNTWKQPGKGQKSLRHPLPLHILLTAFLFSTFLSLTAQECSIHLSATATPATCQGNGSIHCTLSDTAGLQLEQIRYSYLPYQGSDSVTHTELSSMQNLRPGHYRVAVTALCATGQAQGGAYSFVTDTVHDLVIESLYAIPTAGTPSHIFSFSEPYGVIPSLSCQPTGRVQLRMEGGTFPYHVELLQLSGHDTLPLRSTLFDTFQHQGNSPLSSDYHGYYNLDSLFAGRYLLRAYDGCGYHVPDMTVEVPPLRLDPGAYTHLLRNSSLDPQSDNVITLKEVFRMQTGTVGNDDYYRFANRDESLYEYRFINPSRCESPDTTQWLPMPLLNAKGATFLQDTVSAFDNYGDIWFQECQLQIRPRYCEDTLLTFPFHIYPQGGNMYSISTRIRYLYQGTAHYDCSGFHNPGMAYERYAMSTQTYHQVQSVNNYTGDSINVWHQDFYTSAGFLQDNKTGMKYHSYVTLPITLKITDISKDSVLMVLQSTSPTVKWSINSVIDSLLTGDSLIIEAFDKNMSPLYSYLYKYRYNLGDNVVAATEKLFQWDTIPVVDHRHCEGAERTIGLFQRNGYTYSIADSTGHYFLTYASDTVRIISSPEDNRYNFTAVLKGSNNLEITQADSSAALRFRIGRYSPSANSTYPTFEVTGQDLPNGEYVWVVSHDCDQDNDTLVTRVNFLRIPEMAELPQFTFIPECTRLKIVPTAGQYVLEHLETATYFNIHQTEVVEHNGNSGQRGDTLTIGAPGTYVLSMYALPEDDGTLLDLNPCYVWDTTIVWAGATIALDHLYAYVCHADDTVGVVRTRGKEGLLPYQYTLYPEADGNGTPLAVNSSGDFADMPIQLGQIISVEMRDACGAHFSTDITVTDLDLAGKAWAEDGTQEADYYLGDTCHLYGLSLGEVQYHWSGPEGFAAEGQQVSFLISDEVQGGTYRLSIEGTGCGILEGNIRVRILEAPCPIALDFDGNLYETVRIDGLCWTRENLHSEHYSDGREVPHVYRYYSYLYPDSMENSQRFGYLYSWHDAIDTAGDTFEGDTLRQGLCPAGWRLPTASELEALSVWNDALRSPLYWWDGGGSNETGFSALPAGFYNHQKERFENLYFETRFWSSKYNISTEKSTILDFITHCHEGIIRPESSHDAYSIRCVSTE
ncbi:MAG: fibrobacter succinogenes major paralogous domain-containing protein [Bacteroidales bacterium]|nr:fibrobacter succinogenes major paralogous domain-containing protein [Bacteroidales bacterium]